MTFIFLVRGWGGGRQGAPAMRLLLEALPGVKVVAVGHKSELLLGQMGIPTAGQVQHLVNGGETAFAEGMARLM